MKKYKVEYAITVLEAKDETEVWHYIDETMRTYVGAYPSVAKITVLKEDEGGN